MLMSMGTVGRKPKPVEQKRRTGNPGGRKLPPLSVVPLITPQAPPEPHRPLMTARNGGLGAGQQLWKLIWSSASPWLRSDMDVELVMLVCEQTDERTLLRDKMFRIGLEWRERAALRMLEKQIANNLAQLGFTPTDRARLGMSSTSSDALQEFRDRVTQKRTQAK
jgi:hypothetical protein